MQIRKTQKSNSKDREKNLKHKENEGRKYLFVFLIPLCVFTICVSEHVFAILKLECSF